MGDIKYFFKMFRYMKPYMLPYSVGMFLYSAQSFVMLFIISFFTGNIMAAIVAANTRMVINSVLILVGMTVGFLVILTPAIYMYVVCAASATRDAAKVLFRSFTRGSLENAGHSGEGIAAINTDLNTATDVYGDAITGFLTRVANIVFSAIVIFVIDWRLGLAGIGAGLLGFYAQKRFAKPIADISKKDLDNNAEQVKALSNLFSGALTIRAYNMQDRAITTYDRLNNEMKFLGLKRAFISMWQSFFRSVLNWLSTVIIFAFGGWLVATGRLDFHLLMMAPLMFMLLTGGFSGISEGYANLQRPLVGAKRVFAILEADENKPVCKQSGITRDPEGYTLKTEDLSFRYHDAETDALKNINIEIPQNKMVALVGESGSGKSTLLRAIIGMYERENLGITLGDLSFDESSLSGWRRNFAYVDQSCKLFDMSIKENIAMGLGGKASDEDIEAAAKRAAAHDFIQTLENGYEAPCGEKGSTLSGGQKQRIAIARALVKHAPILVFDEATSALDAESERYIMETVESLKSDHTILITTHNLENVVNADKIVVLDNGEVAEEGTHRELMDKKGLYHRLFTREG